MKAIHLAILTLGLAATISPQYAQAASPLNSYVDLVESASDPGEIAVVATYNSELISAKAGMSGEITLSARVIDFDSGQHSDLSGRATTLTSNTLWLGNVRWNASGFKKYIVIISAKIGGETVRLGRSVIYLHRENGQIEKVSRGRFNKGSLTLEAPKPNSKLEPGDVPGEARNNN